MSWSVRSGNEGVMSWSYRVAKPFCRLSSAARLTLGNILISEDSPRAVDCLGETRPGYWARQRSRAVAELTAAGYLQRRDGRVLLAPSIDSSDPATRYVFAHLLQLPKGQFPDDLAIALLANYIPGGGEKEELTWKHLRPALDTLLTAGLVEQASHSAIGLFLLVLPWRLSHYWHRLTWTGPLYPIRRWWRHVWERLCDQLQAFRLRLLGFSDASAAPDQECGRCHSPHGDVRRPMWRVGLRSYSSRHLLYRGFDLAAAREVVLRYAPHLRSGEDVIVTVDVHVRDTPTLHAGGVEFSGFEDAPPEAVSQALDVAELFADDPDDRHESHELLELCNDEPSVWRRFLIFLSGFGVPTPVWRLRRFVGEDWVEQTMVSATDARHAFRAELETLLVPGLPAKTKVYLIDDRYAHSRHFRARHGARLVARAFPLAADIALTCPLLEVAA